MDTIGRVQLNGAHTQPGKTIVVTGDCPELGNRDISKAYSLEYINQQHPPEAPSAVAWHS